MRIRKRITTSNLSSAQFNKVLVLGLGQLGLAVAKYVKGRRFEVYGYDVEIEATRRAEKTVGIKIADDISDFDVYIICVSTHAIGDIFSPSIDRMLFLAERISIKAKKDGALISIESTIPRGTSKKVFEILNHRLHVVYAPHRWYASEEKDHGVNQLRVVGGVRDCCLQVGMRFYNYDAGGHSSASYYTRRSLGIAMHPVSAVEIAETTKVVENAHRYLQIAFAEELYLYCEANNINFSDLRDALNTKWNVDIPEPREGIGGHCLPKDTKMFLESSNVFKSKILTGAMNVDEDYRSYIQFRDKRPLLSPSNLEKQNPSYSPSS